MRRRRRYRKNPDTASTLLIVGGVGIVGYLLWRQFSTPQVYPGLSVPSSPSPFTQLVGAFTNSIVSKQLASADASAWAAAEKRYFLTDRKANGAPADGTFVCIDKTTGKTVDRSVCNALINHARGIPTTLPTAGLSGTVFEAGKYGSIG